MNLTRRTLMMAGALATGSAIAAPRSTATPPGDPALVPVEAAVRDAIAAHACPGAQIAIARKGEFLHSRGYGLSNLQAQTAVTEQSVFRIGSLTKQFAAAATIKLAAGGKLRLDAPAAQYLPVLEKLKPFTLLELMHHTAGLHSDESEAAPVTGSGGPKTQIALAEEIAHQSKPFDFDPGTAWLYSNANYIVLGAVIEAATKTRLQQALSELIFRPLGLSATAMDDSAAVVVGRVSGYTPTADPAHPFADASYIEISDAGGAGAMRSTARDLCRWHEALLSNQLFERKHVELMLAPGSSATGGPAARTAFRPTMRITATFNMRAAFSFHRRPTRTGASSTMARSTDLPPSWKHISTPA